jgi:hypothetical protein
VLTALFGFTDTVSLDIAGLPQGATVTWAQNPLTPSVRTLFTVTTAETTTVGIHPLTVTGIGGSKVHTFSVNLNVTLIQMPNLVIEAVTTDPSIPVMGQSCQVRIRIANPDTKDAAGTFSVDWYLNPASSPTPAMVGDLVWSQTGLTAGEALTLSKSHVFTTAGTHEIYAQIDRLNAIVERDEDDNLTGPLSLVVSSQPQPDLLITALNVMPMTPTVQQPATLTVKVKNQGTLSTTYPIRVDAYLTSTLPGLGDTGDVSATIGSLEAGASTSVQIPYTFTEEGESTLYALVDTLDTVTESIENNNIAGPVVFDVAPPLMPNLVIESMNTIPATPIAGEPCEIQLRVINPDTGVAVSAFAVDWYADPPTPPTSTMVGELNWVQNGLGAGEVVTLTHSYTFTKSQMYTVYAQVDRTEIITERNEADNINGPEPLFVAEPPQSDLLITGVNLKPVTPTTNQPFTITVQVQNQGTLTTTTGVRVDAYFTDTAPGVGDIGDVFSTTVMLAPNATTVVKMQHTLVASGTYTLYVQVDALDRIAESDESNNVSDRHRFNVTTKLFAQRPINEFEPYLDYPQKRREV